MAGVILARLDFGNVSQVIFQLRDDDEELIAIIQGFDQRDNPIAKHASRFEQATAVVWPGCRQQQPGRCGGSLRSTWPRARPSRWLPDDVGPVDCAALKKEHG